MATAAPSQKVTASSLAMSATTLLVWILNHYVLPEPIPGEISALAVTLVGSTVAYFVRPSAADVATTR